MTYTSARLDKRLAELKERRDRLRGIALQHLDKEILIVELTIAAEKEFYGRKEALRNRKGYLRRYNIIDSERELADIDEQLKNLDKKTFIDKYIQARMPRKTNNQNTPPSTPDKKPGTPARGSTGRAPSTPRAAPFTPVQTPQPPVPATPTTPWDTLHAHWASTHKRREKKDDFDKHALSLIGKLVEEKKERHDKEAEEDAKVLPLLVQYAQAGAYTPASSVCSGSSRGSSFSASIPSAIKLFPQENNQVVLSPVKEEKVTIQVLVTAWDGKNTIPKHWAPPMELGATQFIGISIVDRTIVGVDADGMMHPLAGFTPGMMYGYTLKPLLRDNSPPFPLQNVKNWQTQSDLLLVTFIDGEVRLYQQQIGGAWGKPVRFFSEPMAAAGFVSPTAIFGVTKDMEKKDTPARILFANVTEPSVICNRLDENGVAKVQFQHDTAEDGEAGNIPAPTLLLYKVYNDATVPRVYTAHSCDKYACVFFATTASKTKEEQTLIGIKKSPQTECVKVPKAPAYKVKDIAVDGNGNYFIVDTDGSARHYSTGENKSKMISLSHQLAGVTSGANQSFFLMSSTDGKTLISAKLDQSGKSFSTGQADLTSFVENIGEPVKITSVCAVDGFVGALLDVQVGHEAKDSKPSAKKAKIRGEPFNNNAVGNEMPGATDTTE